MSHAISAGDESLRDSFEARRFPPRDFSHAHHVRLAYLYLVQSHGVVDAAHQRMHDALVVFLKHLGVESAAKYHDTMTRAWILAVRHFMEHSLPRESSEDFIRVNSRLLDSKIMLTHYSAEVLFSADARGRFVEPDLQPIPRH